MMRLAPLVVVAAGLAFQPSAATADILCFGDVGPLKGGGAYPYSRAGSILLRADDARQPKGAVMLVVLEPRSNGSRQPKEWPRLNMSIPILDASGRIGAPNSISVEYYLGDATLPADNAQFRLTVGAGYDSPPQRIKWKALDGKRHSETVVDITSLNEQWRRQMLTGVGVSVTTSSLGQSFDGPVDYEWQPTGMEANLAKQGRLRMLKVLAEPPLQNGMRLLLDDQGTGLCIPEKTEP